MPAKPLPSLAQRIASLSTWLALTIVVLVAASSWLVTRHEQVLAHDALLMKQLELHASSAVSRLQAIHGEVERTANGSLIANALVDSSGKDAYLVPFLQGLQRIEGVPVSLVFTDFEGKEIARGGEYGFRDEHFTWLEERLAQPERPLAAIFGGDSGAELVGVAFVHYSRTPTPEGALMYKVRVSDLQDDAAPIHWGGLEQSAEHSHGPFVQALRLPPPLDVLGLHVELANLEAIPQKGHAQTLLFYVAIMAIALAVAVAASRRIGRLLSDDLRRLSEFAGDVAASEFQFQHVNTGSTREVVRVTDTLNAMLRQLHEQHQRLQEESEAKFRNLVENLPGAAYRCSPDALRTMEYISPGVEELCGYPAADFVGNARRSYGSLIHPDDCAAVDQTIARALQDHAPYVLEYRIIDAGGRVRWIWERGQARRDEAGRIAYLDGVLAEILERKESEAAMLRARQEAEAANLAKSQFLATMSHEIRTPLNGILGMAQLLMLADLSDDERLEYARTVLNSGQTLLTVLNDILDLSKVEAGHLDLHPHSFDPIDVIEETAALFTGPATEKGLALDASWQGPPRQRYRADPIRLRQMLSNYVINAIKFTAKGGIAISAREVSRSGGHAMLEFAVSDTGIGIPREKLAGLFTPFNQVDGSRTREYGGTGLGLSIVRSLSRLMGGDVGVDSEAGRGSRFWFRIRAELQRFEPALTLPPEIPAPRLPERRQAPGHAHVLVVEDNAVNRKVVQTMLSRFGIASECVVNGQEAVEAITTGRVRPDLVLMDVQMPVMDGIAATLRIREWEARQGRPRLPIVALTAGAFNSDREHCMAGGMDDFLTKPVQGEHLLAVLERWSLVQPVTQL